MTDVDINFASIRDNCLALHLQRAARSVSRGYDAALKPVGLTSGQYTLLVALSRPEPATMAELAKELAMDRTTLIANIKPLERRGLIVAITSRSERARRLMLTDSGRSVLELAVPLWRDVQARFRTKLAASETTYLDLRAITDL